MKNSISKSEEIYREYYKTLTLFDDILFRRVAENKAFVEELLRVFLGDTGLKVIESIVQKSFSILNQKGVILDCYCKLSDGRLVNIEIERNDVKNKCDHQKRVRYYGSIINVNNLKKGQSYDDLPDVYMIYLTSKDIFKMGKTTYHVDRVLRESDNVVDNGYHEIYINAEVDDKTDISEVMKIMTTKDYVNENFKTISEVKEEKKMPIEVQEAIADMQEFYSTKGRAEGMAKGKAEGKAEGRTEGKAEGRTETFIQLLKQGIIDESVVLSNLNITKEKLEEILKERA